MLLTPGWILADATGTDNNGTKNKPQFALHITTDLTADVLEQIYKLTGHPGPDLNGSIFDTQINMSNKAATLPPFGVVGKNGTCSSGSPGPSQIFYKL